ncbi:MAG: transposase [Hassallia sp. WJT32-NPBG1]|nr:transposase [Hassallia sp. WJT32-NPBG1]
MLQDYNAHAGTQRRDWQHKVTSEIASRYDIGVTEHLNTKGMTRKAKKGSKRKKQKAGLNKSILSVGFGTLNKMLTYKIEAKGGLMIVLPTKNIKPSQRCPKCGIIHKEWAELSNRHHVCSDCGFEIPRDAGSAIVMYNVVTNQQPGLRTSLDSLGCLSSTSKTSKCKNTGSMKQRSACEETKIRASGGTGRNPVRRKRRGSSYETKKNSSPKREIFLFYTLNPASPSIAPAGITSESSSKKSS